MPTTLVGLWLDHLEAAAFTAKLGTAPGTHPEALLMSTYGPYNPVALMSMRIAKKIMDMELVEMAEIVPEEDFLKKLSAKLFRLP